MLAVATCRPLRPSSSNALLAFGKWHRQVGVSIDLLHQCVGHRSGCSSANRAGHVVRPIDAELLAAGDAADSWSCECSDVLLDLRFRCRVPASAPHVTVRSRPWHRRCADVRLRRSRSSSDLAGGASSSTASLGKAIEPRSCNPPA